MSTRVPPSLPPSLVPNRSPWPWCWCWRAGKQFKELVAAGQLVPADVVMGLVDAGLEQYVTCHTPSSTHTHTARTLSRTRRS